MTRRRAVAAGAALLASTAVRAASDPSASAAAGTFLGTREPNGVMAFRGIRYGRAARFRAPVAEARAAAPVRAFAYGASCPQTARSETQPKDEDCLFLNVWTPAPDRGRRPVLVYIHGGAYATGSGTSPLTDGSLLAARDCVVVTLNHRLNAFGYLYLTSLDPRFPDSGNAGQLDLILALRWVAANVAAFGGDPGNVTLFGQSGGGAKIATMLGMPAARGLFHRAMTMSGQQVTVQGPRHAEARTRAFMAACAASDVDSLRAMPAARLVEGLAAVDPILGGHVYSGPVLDLVHVVRHPFWPDADPAGRAIPLILGNTRRETAGFIDPAGPLVRGLTWDNLAARIGQEIRIDLPPEWIVARYRERFPNWSPEELFYDATTAGRSWPGQLIEAEARADAGVPAWVYQVDYPSRLEPRRGAFHTIDIPLAFGTLAAAGSETGTDAAARGASRALQDRLVAFARTGAPNGPGLPGWEPYDRARRTTLIVDAVPRMEDDPRRFQRELFARAPYIQPGG